MPKLGTVVETVMVLSFLATMVTIYKMHQDNVAFKSQPVSLAVSYTPVLICVDQQCYDQWKYVTDQATLIKSIQLYGNPGWQTVLNYKPGPAISDTKTGEKIDPN